MNTFRQFILQFNRRNLFHLYKTITVVTGLHAKQRQKQNTETFDTCHWHSPSRQRLLYFLYALTASSLRTNTTSATPTLTSRARFKAPHTQNSSCGRPGDTRALSTSFDIHYINRLLANWGLLTTMSSSVTRGCRLFTVILVPSKGLKAG